MENWKSLSRAERWHIENDILWAFQQIGVGDAIAEWIEPSKLPHWQLCVYSTWCIGKSNDEIERMIARGMEKANVRGPKESVTLCGLTAC